MGKSTPITRPQATTMEHLPDQVRNPDADSMQVKPPRPAGIAILSALAIFGGLVIGGLLLYFALYLPPSERRRMGQGVSETLGVPPSLLIASVAFLGLLGAASGIGMWLGRKWGWWLGSFWQVYALFRNANALYATYQLSSILPPEELAAMPGGLAKYYIKFGGRAIISALLYWYFFKSNVREFFGLQNAALWKAALAQVGLCIAIFIAMSAAAASLQ
ncbi:MAG TPA: hypothetical protein VEQ85_01255 [Lacipirellulaceae bacterium]|nr:hypothetical protein [Lacipirellulaceae bacterium]